MVTLPISDHGNSCVSKSSIRKKSHLKGFCNYEWSFFKIYFSYKKLWNDSIQLQGAINEAKCTIINLEKKLKDIILYSNGNLLIYSFVKLLGNNHF